MNGRKRKWKGGQGEEKGTDFQIKFSGHLNKHLSQWSNGRGTAGGTCVSWATLEAFQQDTSNKQHLKKHACSPSQGFSSEILPLQFPPCLQLSPKLASISSPILLPSKGDPGLGDPHHGCGVPPLSQPSSPVQGRAVVDPQGPSSLEEERRRQSHPVPSHPAVCCRLFFFKNKRAKGESRNCRAIKNKNESPSMN